MTDDAPATGRRPRRNAGPAAQHPEIFTTTTSARLSFLPKPVKNGHAAALHLSLERSF